MGNGCPSPGRQKLPLKVMKCGERESVRNRAGNNYLSGHSSWNLGHKARYRGCVRSANQNTEVIKVYFW